VERYVAWVWLVLKLVLGAAGLLCFESHELTELIRGYCCYRTTCAKRQVNKIGALDVPIGS